jgi:cyclin-dependent kinase 8/11
VSYCKSSKKSDRKLTDRYWRAPELLFSPTSYDAFALDLWGIGVVISDLHSPNIDDQSDSDDSDSNSEESLDPLEADDCDRSPKARARLFNDTFGDVGLAASIFRLLGTPTPQTWPVSTSGISLSEQLR